MRLFSKAPDGGEDSGVTAYFLIEWKSLFSVALLRFEKGSSREAYHTHAFNAVTWWLKGEVLEERMDLAPKGSLLGRFTGFMPSFKPKYTSRENMHKIHVMHEAWALTFRGPWNKEWKESKDGVETTLTHGRKEV